MEKKEKIFVDGLIFKKPREGAPDFVKGSISIKVDELVAFLGKHQKNGWVNADLKMSQKGSLYFELNTWEKASTPPLTEEEKAKFQALRAGENAKVEALKEEGEVNVSDIPF